MDSVQLLGVRIDSVTFQECRRIVAQWLARSEEVHVIGTPNPEICVRAFRSEAYRQLLNTADLAIPDGIGLLGVARLKRLRLKERVAGADLLPEIFALCAQMKLVVGIALPSSGLSEISRVEAMLQNYAGLRAVVVKEDDEKIMEKLQDAVFVAVALGSPRQEEWIARARMILRNVRVYMSVGAAIDFLTGRSRRAPRMMRVLGLEWAWRLLHSFVERGDDVVRHKTLHRLRRIWTAVVVFPLLALTNKK